MSKVGVGLQFSQPAHSNGNNCPQYDGVPFPYSGNSGGGGDYYGAPQTFIIQNGSGGLNGGNGGGGGMFHFNKSPEAVLTSHLELGLGWDDNELKIRIKDLQQQINGLRWMHEQAARYYGRRLKWISYPLKILPALSGISSISFQSNESGQQPLLLAIGIIFFLILFLNEFLTASRWPALHRNHRITALEYRRILRNIYREQLKPKHKRVALQDLETYVISRKDQLTPMSLEIPSKIEKKFIKSVKKNNKKGGGGGYNILPDTILPDIDEELNQSKFSSLHRYKQATLQSSTWSQNNNNSNNNDAHLYNANQHMMLSNYKKQKQWFYFERDLAESKKRWRHLRYYSAFLKEKKEKE